jgi:glycosyltransferase involved in cell wall biosynthesis
MRILHCVEFYHPSVGGTQYVARALAERLARRGHEVTVATSHHPERTAEIIGGVRVASFRISGNLVRGLEGEVDAYHAFLARGGFDVVTLFGSQQWATDVALRGLDALGAAGAKVVFVPTGFSYLFDPAYAAYFARMPEWMRTVDANVFLAERYRDVEFARAHGIANGHLIPNGASEEEFGAPSNIDVRAMLGIPKDHALVLHVGSFTGLKGQEEAIEIFRRARLRRATILLVGDASHRRIWRRCRRRVRLFSASPRRLLDRTSVRAVSLPRDATVAAFQAADLFLFPSNIECSPIVLFEAAAAGTPFLSTDVGNAGEIARWTGAGELLPTTTRDGLAHADLDGSAEALRRLLADAPRRAEMAAAGTRAWRERFTWDGIAARYETLYAGLLR